jgi:HK97 family phage prohead protease
METKRNDLPNREIRVYDIPVQVEVREEGKKRVVSGYAAVFGQMSRNLGWFREVIERGAFDNVLDQDVVALYNHDYNHVLARTISKTLQLEVDERGLKYTFEAPNTTIGNDLVEMISRGDVQHSSFAFTVQDEKWSQDEENGEVRTVLKVKRLYDVSPVVMPAYTQTDVSLAKRSYDDWKKKNEPPYDDLPDMEDELELLKIK